MSRAEHDPVAATAAVYDASAGAYAASYDAWAPAPGASDLVALTVAGLTVGARIADVGSGSGRDLARLRAAGCDAFGIDVAAGLARHAAAHGPVVVADVRRLPLGDGSLDAALCAASLLHLPDGDVRVALAELRRVLRPGGRLVVSVKEGVGEHVDTDGRYFRLYTAGGIDRLLADAGFAVTAASRDRDACRSGLHWLVRVADRA